MDYKENFMLATPTGVVRHPSGKPMVGMNPEDKKAFAKWFFDNGYTEEGTTHEERDELFLQWKNKT